MTLLYTEEETAEIRAKVINDYTLQIVAKAFQKYPQLNSAYFAVAQYWSDQAFDEVSKFILYSVLDVPGWHEITISEQYVEKGYARDSINLPNIKDGHYQITGNAYQEIKNILNVDFDGLTSEMIASFAAFCKEGSHQGMDYTESYTPYALFTRSNEGIKVEIVGKMLRPWLDGIRPEEEF